MEPILREHTSDKARRLIRSLMQVHMCKMRWGEAGPEASVWEQMHWIASGFLEEARKEWSVWLNLSAISETELMPIIIDALTEAQRTAAFPYQERLTPEWIEAALEAFLKSFNPNDLYPYRGSSQ